MKALIVKVIGIHDHRQEEIENFWEEEMLLNSLGVKVVEKTVQHRFSPHPSTYVGKGKIEEIKNKIKEKGINVILLNDIVNPAQIFRFEKSLWEVNPDIKVFDRYDLILNIFEKRAFSSEAKLQIDLARLRHLGPRIYGLGGKFLSRQAGGIGGRGIGEKELELMHRYIKERIRIIEKKIKKSILRKEKNIIQRRENGFISWALVGYTNAGKTTLFNRLTGKEKLVKDSVFTTLESCVGRLKIHGKKILLADTIGFIRNLPPSLIDAFKSTLMEVIYASKIFLVLDIADLDFLRKKETVEKILKELKIDFSKVVYLLNKSDLLSKEERRKISIFFQNKKFFFISAKTGEGIDLEKFFLI